MTATNTHSSLIKHMGLALPDSHAAPSGEPETTIMRIFAEVLSLDHVGMDDEFLDLGGDSLLAEVLSARVSELTGKEFPPPLLTEYGSPRQIASWLRTPSEASFIDRQPSLQSRVEDQIRALTSDWEGERASPDALVLGHNRSGNERPLFWCLQIREELNQLALRLGPERPLYGMCSGALAMSSTMTNTAALARRYVDEILAIEQMGPYLLGGNCRGGRVAIEIARQLQDSGRHILLLTLLDVTPWDVFLGRVYPGKVAFLYGIHSRFNPYRRFRSPELGWRKLFPQGFQLDLLPTDHGQYFSARGLPMLVGKLQSALEWAEGSTSTVTGGLGGRLPNATYRARLRTAERLTMRSGEDRVIEVEVTNASQVTWPASAESGITLGNHWLTCRGEVLIWGDGRTPLQQQVIPNAKATLNLQVRAPSEPGEYLLEIDLAEEGVVWFKERGSAAAVVPTTVLDRGIRASWFSPRKTPRPTGRILP